ncbi:MAG: hypothetical protein KGZ75_10570 [Syntrophomonadaceae bacterium]|nr:hypothetical protein [Syntrophomonadaceae bacterium]
MSYDLQIYTIKEQQFSELMAVYPKMKKYEHGLVLPLRCYQIVIMNETPIEDEDIPHEISKRLPGLRYLIECSLEPITDNKNRIKELLKIAQLIAKNGVGVIFNPQTDEIILPSGIKRLLKPERTERFAVLVLSWWFNHEDILEVKKLCSFIKTLERYLPESLPRRYGEYEPPKELFSDIPTFAEFLLKNSRHIKVWYPTKPVDYVNFAIPEFIGPMVFGYRFGNFSISIDAGVLEMPGWKAMLKRLFEKVALELDAFYGDIYLLKNQIRSRSASFSDYLSEQHPIVSWWWNGIPETLGCGILAGNQIKEYVRIEKPTSILNNGSAILINDDFDLIKREQLRIDKDIIQPRKLGKSEGLNFSGLYPAIWPFAGPKKICHR